MKSLEEIDFPNFFIRILKIDGQNTLKVSVLRIMLSIVRYSRELNS